MVGSGQSHAWGFSRKCALKRAGADADGDLCMSVSCLWKKSVLFSIISAVSLVSELTHVRSRYASAVMTFGGLLVWLLGLPIFSNDVAVGEAE